MRAHDVRGPTPSGHGAAPCEPQEVPGPPGGFATATPVLTLTAAGTAGGSAGPAVVALDLVCFSYLADTSILTVDRYPDANHGAVVHDTRSSIAADGPIVALCGATLGLRTALITNPVGCDPVGRQLIDTLNGHHVHHALAPQPGRQTPHMTVITDALGTRTWFAHLDAVAGELMSADLRPLTRARLAYIDCYRILEAPAARAITAAVSTPLLLNLGGDPLSPVIEQATAGRRVAMLQTNLDENQVSHAGALARELLARVPAQAVVITLGSEGAYVLRSGTAASRPDMVLDRPAEGQARAGAEGASFRGCLVSAPRSEREQVHSTHGAGAAFSAGYAHALLAGADPVTATRAGCDLGTAHCTTGALAPAQTATSGSR